MFYIDDRPDCAKLPPRKRYIKAINEGTAKYWQWYEPNIRAWVNGKYNEKGIGDCMIRALTVALDCTWREAWDHFSAAARALQDNTATALYECLKKRGWVYVPCPAIKGHKRMTPERFCREHKTGVYVLRLAGHVVAVKNGKFWDIWDCGRGCVYGYLMK